MPERLRMPVAAHLFLVRGDEVLLLRRSNTGYEDGNFSFPAGHLGGGESVVEAMIRETHEGIGVQIAPDDLRILHVMHRFAEEERIDYFLTADRWSGDVSIGEPDKCDLLQWFPIAALPQNTIPYVARGVRYWREGVPFPIFGR